MAGPEREPDFFHSISQSFRSFISTLVADFLQTVSRSGITGGWYFQLLISTLSPSQALMGKFMVCLDRFLPLTIKTKQTLEQTIENTNQ